MTTPKHIYIYTYNAHIYIYIHNIKHIQHITGYAVRRFVKRASSKTPFEMIRTETSLSFFDCRWLVHCWSNRTCHYVLWFEAKVWWSSFPPSDKCKRNIWRWNRKGKGFHPDPSIETSEDRIRNMLCAGQALEKELHRWMRTKCPSENGDPWLNLKTWAPLT